MGPPAQRASLFERIRLFVGFVLTPEFGVGGGMSFEVLRGLAVSVGGAMLIVDALEGDMV